MGLFSDCCDEDFFGNPKGGGCAGAFILLTSGALAFGAWQIGKLINNDNQHVVKAKSEKTIDTIAKTRNDSTFFMKSMATNHGFEKHR